MYTHKEHKHSSYSFCFPFFFLLQYICNFGFICIAINEHYTYDNIDIMLSHTGISSSNSLSVSSGLIKFECEKKTVKRDIVMWRSNIHEKRTRWQMFVCVYVSACVCEWVFVCVCGVCV